MAVWPWVASGAASILFGLFSVLVLVRCGGHRRTGVFKGSSVIECFVVGMAFYTFLTVCIGHFFLHIPVSETVVQGFSDNRMAYLLLGVLADNFARLWGMFFP